MEDVLDHLRAIRASQEATALDIREIKGLLDRIESRISLIEVRLPLGISTRGFGL